MDRGPSTISTGLAWKTGRGLPIPNGPSESSPRTRSGVIAFRLSGGVDPQARPQLIGFEHVVGIGVDARAELRHARCFHRQSGRLFVAAEADEHVAAVLERAEHVEVGNAAARAVGDVAVDRKDDRRLVVRVDQLGRGDADDAAMPALAADDEDVVRADCRVCFDGLLRLADELGFFLLPAQVLVIQLLREIARFLGHLFVRREEQPRRDVRAAHPAGRVDARRDHERDLVAVDRLSGEA